MKIIKFKGNILRLSSEVDVTSKEHLAKVVTQKSFAKKKTFLNIRQNSQENVCAGDIFWDFNSIKKRLLHRRFPVNFVRIMTTAF